MGSVVNDETARVGALLRTSSQELICEPSEFEWLGAGWEARDLWRRNVLEIGCVELSVRLNDALGEIGNCELCDLR